MKIPVMGSLFGGCSCGGPLTSGVPCHHIVAVVKTSQITGLNETNEIPKWWTTEMWRMQFPQAGTLSCDFDMKTLREIHTARTDMKYCPPYAVGNKSGRPKKEKRLKSSLEGKKNIK